MYILPIVMCANYLDQTSKISAVCVYHFEKNSIKNTIFKLRLKRITLYQREHMYIFNVHLNWRTFQLQVFPE
jgi:hypothetical protein